MISRFLSYKQRRNLAASCLIGTFLANFASAASTDLFGYRQTSQTDIGVFPQWVSTLERHLLDDLVEGDCNSRTLNSCHLKSWLGFLRSIRNLPRPAQIERVNEYANTKDYVLDIQNYGLEDYWAVPRQFLYNGGDCEDYAITKFFSLRWLGYSIQTMRIVVIQDTNLRVPHAVLAIESDEDYLILDNQVSDVLSHSRIVHYAPVYSINSDQWWIHVPE